MIPPCGKYSCQNLGRFLCKGCRKKFYCGEECSKEEWPGHRRDCRKEVERRRKAHIKRMENMKLKREERRKKYEEGERRRAEIDW